MKKVLVVLLALAMMMTCVSLTAFAAENTDGERAESAESLDGMFEKVTGNDVSRTNEGMIFSGESGEESSEAFHYVTSEKLQISTDSANSDRDIPFSFKILESEMSGGARQIYFSFTENKDDEPDITNGVYVWMSDGVMFGNDQTYTGPDCGVEDTTNVFDFSVNDVVSGTIHRENETVWVMRANGAQVFVKNIAQLEAMNAADGFYLHIICRNSVAGNSINAKMAMTSLNGEVLGTQRSDVWVNSNGSKANASDMYNEPIPSGHMFSGKSNYMLDGNGNYTGLGVIATRNGLNTNVAADLDGYTFSYTLDTTSTNAFVYLGFANINWGGNTINDDRLMANEMMDFPLGVAAIIRLNPHSYMDGQSGAVNVQMRIPVEGMTSENNPADLTQEQMSASLSTPTTKMGAEPVNNGHTITFIEVEEGEWRVTVNGSMIEMIDDTEAANDFSATFNKAMNALEEYGAYPVLQVADLDRVDTADKEPIDANLLLKGMGTQQLGQLEPTLVIADAPAKPTGSDVTETSIRFTFNAPAYNSKYWTIGGYIVERVGADNSEKTWKLDAADELVIEDTGLKADTRYFYYITAVIDENAAEPVVLVRFNNLVIETASAGGGNTNPGGNTEETGGGCSGSAAIGLPSAAVLLTVTVAILMVCKKKNTERK